MEGKWKEHEREMEGKLTRRSEGQWKENERNMKGQNCLGLINSSCVFISFRISQK